MVLMVLVRVKEWSHCTTMVVPVHPVSRHSKGMRQGAVAANMQQCDEFETEHILLGQNKKTTA
jgi:hypothetical protein